MSSLRRSIDVWTETEFFKAFDRVWHGSLLHKLSKLYGVRGKIFINDSPIISFRLQLTEIRMADNDLPESPSFGLLGLSFCKNLSWTDYITSIAKSASMKIGSLFRSRAYLTNEAIMYLQVSH